MVAKLTVWKTAPEIYSETEMEPHFSEWEQQFQLELVMEAATVELAMKRAERKELLRLWEIMKETRFGWSDPTTTC